MSMYPLHRSKGQIALVAAGAFTLFSFLSVNWYPTILPDSLHYLAHASDLRGTGLIQMGFRQVGYPLWLYVTGSVAAAAGFAPLHGVVVAQYSLLAAAIAACVWAMRWWSIAPIALLTLPSAVAYANLLLTEAIATPIAVICAAALVGAYRLQRIGKPFRVPSLVAATLATVLPMIRLHYALMTLAVLVGLVLLSDPQKLRRPRTYIVPSLVIIALILFAGALTLENQADEGVASPSLGSERALFWVVWETVVPNNREAIRTQLPDVYSSGSSDAVIVAIDNSGLDYHSRVEAYDAATTSILRIAGTTLMEQRIASALGAVFGTRLDDVGPALLYTARKDSGLAERDIHHYTTVRPADPSWIAETYNEGTAASPVLMAATSLPALPLPYLGRVLSFVVPIITVLSGYLLIDPRSRRLAMSSTVVTVGYPAASFLFVFDNLRYLLPAYLSPR